MKKRELRERISDLEQAYGGLVHADAQAHFYRQTLEMTLQSQQRDINRILERLEPTETKMQPAKPRPENDAPEKYPAPGWPTTGPCPESNRKPDPRRQPAGDSDKLLCLHVTKMTRQLAIARDTLALYADEKYWDGDHCPMLRNGAAAHALGEMAAVDVSKSAEEGGRDE